MEKKVLHINYLMLPLTVVLLLLALISMHDVATAQGVGLYLSIQWGKTDRVPFDVLVDVCGMGWLLLALVFPYRLLAHRGAKAFFRLTAGYFAFLPILSPAMLVHLFDGHNLFVVEFGWENSFDLLSNFCREAGPIMILLWMLYNKAGFSRKSWHVILVALQGVCAVGMLFLPELSWALMYIAFYLLLIVAYDWWENLLVGQNALYLKILNWLILGVFFGRGCYRLLDMMSHF